MKTHCLEIRETKCEHGEHELGRTKTRTDRLNMLERKGVWMKDESAHCLEMRRERQCEYGEHGLGTMKALTDTLHMLEGR